MEKPYLEIHTPTGHSQVTVDKPISIGRHPTNVVVLSDGMSSRQHCVVEREGDDLHCVIPISFPQAALGTELEIQTLEGMETIRIPEGTQSGKEFRLRGKGVPHLNERGKGDLIVEIRVQTPARLNKHQKDLLRQLGETMEIENTPTSRGIFDKVKEMFN